MKLNSVRGIWPCAIDSAHTCSRLSLSRARGGIARRYGGGRFLRAFLWDPNSGAHVSECGRVPAIMASSTISHRPSPPYELQQPNWPLAPVTEARGEGRSPWISAEHR